MALAVASAMRLCENLKTYEVAMHVNGQDTLVDVDAARRFAERRLYVRWTETCTLEAAAVA